MNELLPQLPARLNDVLDSTVYFKPELCLTALFLLVLLADLFLSKKLTWIAHVVACLSMLVVIQADIYQYRAPGGLKMLFGGMLVFHHPGVVFKLITDTLAILLFLYFPWDAQLKKHQKGLGDAYTIIVGSVLGIHLMLMVANLLSVFLAIEMVSIASYLLVAYQSDKALSAEASLKYVLFGMAASAVMLYGISLVYAFTGTLSLFNIELVNGIQQLNQPALVLALLLIMAGIGFKLGAVPLHFWVPDVYQGSATPVMAYISTLPKLGAFGLLFNFLMPFAYERHWFADHLQPLIAAISIITMLVGNFAAVWQNNVKRMLAYSSIGHTGFALMALLCFNAQGTSALAFYLAIYAVANIGTLALATYFKNVADADDVADYRGLGLKYPLASVCYVVLLISLTGLPVTTGFNAKLLVFSANYSVYRQSHNVWLLATLITGALTTVVSLFYYLKIPLNLFLKKSDTDIQMQSSNVYLSVFYVVLTVFILVFGIFPDFLARFL
ncbi:NADH-quinone oxidoreductase subunit N [Mucilaginibacter koreensis]